MYTNVYLLLTSTVLILFYNFCFLATDSVLDNLISCNKLDKSFRQKVKDTLLCKHRHHRSAGFRRNLSNIMSSRKSFNHSSTKISKNNTNGNFHDPNHAVSTNSNGSAGGIDSAASALTNAAMTTAAPSGIKLFRNYSQPAFPTSNGGPGKTHHTPPSVYRTDSMPQGGSGHLVYPPSSQNHNNYHDADDENMENKV